MSEAPIAIGMFGAFGRALRAMTRQPVVVLGVCLVYAALSAMLIRVFFGDGSQIDLMDQAKLIPIVLKLSGSFLAIEVIFGPIFAAVAIYVARATERGASLYGALNYALNRYGRMFVPHLSAQLSIGIGMAIVLPGILFFLQYAFVDAIAVLEKEKWPLSRSKKLTKGRRRTLFLLVLPYVIIMQAWILVDLWALKIGPLPLVLAELVVRLYTFALAIACYELYVDRVTPKAAPAAA